MPFWIRIQKGKDGSGYRKARMDPDPERQGWIRIQKGKDVSGYRKARMGIKRKMISKNTPGTVGYFNSVR